MRYVMGLVLVVGALTAGCSRSPERAVGESPASPSAIAVAPAIGGGGVSRPMDFTFPAQADAYRFFTELETKYQVSLGRPATQTHVDQEGVIVWIQEYVRHRANGCDAATASSRVLAQIDGGAAGAECAVVPAGTFNVGTHGEVSDFRRTLETKYQQMGRGQRATFIDLEGQAIWFQQYLRYRLTSCDYSTAVTKVFTMIDGGAEPVSCYVGCGYRITPDTITTGVGTLNSTFEIRPNPTACEYTLSSNASWLTFPADQRVGNGFFHVPFSVAANLTNADRTGVITATWSGGSATFTVRQTGSPYSVSFTLVDGYRSVNTTNECHVRSNPTPCTFTGSTNLPGNNVTFTWAAFYTYGEERVRRQSSTSNTFVISESCGGAGSTSGNGTDSPLTVELRVEDDRGNVVTIASGQGAQPSLLMKLYSCGS